MVHFVQSHLYCSLGSQKRAIMDFPTPISVHNKDSLASCLCKPETVARVTPLPRAILRGIKSDSVGTGHSC